MISVAMVEDHPETAKRLQAFVDRYAKEKKVDLRISHFSCSEDLFPTLSNNYGLILMDIQLTGMDGMSAAKKLREEGYGTPLIFITSLAQYAVHGYDVDALDFIVKPVSYYQFAMKMDKAYRKISRNLNVNLTISVDRSLCVISSSDLYYVETAHHDLLFHTIKQTYRSRGSLSNIEMQLSKAHYLRINTCYFINMEYISSLNGSSITMANGDELFISRARRKDVLSTIAQFLGGSI